MHSLPPTPPLTEGQLRVSPFLPVSPQRWRSKSHGVSNSWAFGPNFCPERRFLTHRHLVSTEDSLLLKSVVALKVRVRPPGWCVLSGVAGYPDAAFVEHIRDARHRGAD